MIREAFISSLRTFTDPDQCEQFWGEIERAYTAAGRHYHTLAHLNHLMTELSPYQNQFRHWDTIVFAIVYHDTIYSTRHFKNEVKSAKLAVNRLRYVGFPEPELERCRNLILATEKHGAGDYETNLFTDADLSILGAEPEPYRQYAAQVRKEYYIFPEILYQSGRKKVLRHFLSMPRIFKSQEFYERYEMKARMNLQDEMKTFV